MLIVLLLVVITDNRIANNTIGAISSRKLGAAESAKKSQVSSASILLLIGLFFLSFLIDFCLEIMSVSCKLVKTAQLICLAVTFLSLSLALRMLACL